VTRHLLIVALLAMPDPCLGGAAPTQVATTGTIRGQVVDARTGAAVTRVLVLIDAEGRQEARTGPDGRFELQQVPAGPQRLFVSVVGYILVQRDVTVAPGQVLEVVIPLTEGTGTYTESVTVAADPFRAADTAVAAQQLLGSADLQNLRGVLADDPLRAVQVLPGVATGDDLRSEFSVRGSDFAHMNFTVEGFSTPFLLHTVRGIEDRANSGSVAMINSDILEEVALLNGGYPQRYGNRTGAEVDFRLRDGSRDRRQVRVGVSGTSASAVVEGPFHRRGSWLLSARKSYVDLLVKRLRAEEIAFSFADVQSKAVYDVTDRQRVDLTVVAGRSRLEDTDEDDRTDRFVGRNQAAIAVAGWRLTRSRAVLSARLLGAVSEFRNDETHNPSLDEGEERQLAGRLDATYTFNPDVQLELGAELEANRETRRRDRVSGGAVRTINQYSAEATRSGAFAMLRVQVLPTLLVTPGVRGDHSTLTRERTASPWLQAEWRATPSTSVRASGGIYRQFPGFEQAVGSLGSPENRHERATHYDIGVEARLGTTMRWQVTLYDREEHDFLRRPGVEPRIVDGRIVRGSNTAVYRNQLDGHARGVEVLVQRRDPNKLSGWIGYAYGRNRYRDTVTREAFWGDLDQRHTFNLYAHYRWSDRSSVSGKLRLGSNFPVPGYYSERDGEYFLAERRNEVRLPLYARMDVRANRTFNWSRKRLTLFAEVINVLNRDNLRFDPPSINTVTRRASGLFETMLPILPSAGVLIEF
jgi:TonB dependent receptor/Carboxypeptidase regulatory-like domain